MNEFIQIKSSFLEEKISYSSFKVFCILLNYSKNGICYPSVRSLTEKYAISSQTMQNALKELEEKGLILKENRTIGKGKKTSNCYYLNEKYLVIKRQKKTKVPEWFDKKTEKKEMSKEELNEIEKMIEDL